MNDAPVKKPRRQRRATIREVEALRGAGRHSIGDGLLLVVSPSGRRSWIARVRDPSGRRRDIGLGPYPAVSPDKAREKAEELRTQTRLGLDPVHEKKSARHKARTIPTFGDYAVQYIGSVEAGWKNQKHRQQWRNSLEQHASPLWDRRVDEVSTDDILDALRPIWLRTPETASRVRGRIEKVLSAAKAIGLRPTDSFNPATWRGHLDTLLPKQPSSDRHFAALSYNKLPALVASLGAGATTGRVALRFLILTAARSGEVRGARWNEIDFESKVWTVPANRMKAGREHVVPLSNEALAILKAIAEQRGEEPKRLIFPGLRGNPLSDMTLTKVLRSAITAEATVHGFRSAFRDWVSEQTSFPGEWAEAALAHTNPNKVEAAYRRTNFLEQRRKLMAAWADFCTGGTGKVVQMKVSA